MGPDRSGPGPLPNPETAWQRAQPAPDPRGLVEARLDRVPDEIKVLSGGQANTNLLLDGDQVLRVYQREPRAAAREAQLLRRSWRRFRVPQVLDVGEDFLLLEYVPHEPLTTSRVHAEAAGRALAEIHETTYEAHGLLSSELEVERAMPDVLEAYIGHLLDGSDELGTGHTAIRERAVAHLRASAGRLGDVLAQPVLLHGDFKASNLHWTADGELLVLDWEFAYAGPALMDVGQLFRWDPGEAFHRGFIQGYWGDGNEHEAAFTAAATLDLVNLVDLLVRSPPASRREEDVRSRIEERLSIR